MYRLQLVQFWLPSNASDMRHQSRDDQRHFQEENSINFYDIEDHAAVEVTLSHSKITADSTTRKPLLLRQTAIEIVEIF